MRDWERYERARELRKQGNTLKQIGDLLEVSPQRVRQMIAQVDVRDKWASMGDWHAHLSNSARISLLSAGFDSRESCMEIAADDLRIYKGYARFKDDFSKGHKDWHRVTGRKLNLSTVNEVREWLGAAPYRATKQEMKEPSPEAIKRAMRVLERAGYSVVGPDGNRA